MSAQVQFSEEAQILGCGNSSYGDGTSGGGIAFFDFDQDGWDDITLSSEEGTGIRFFKNNAGTFSEVDFGITNTYEHKTVQWVDFDNDGDYDFFATSNTQKNHLYENTGNMEFTDITLSAGLDLVDHRTFGGSWGDYDNDGLLDVFLCSMYENSANFHNLLFKNNGDGTFTDVTSQAGIIEASFLSFCSAFFDYDNDGWQDIYVANDRDPQNQMYHNNGDGTFTEVGAQTGTNVSVDAMSTTIGDYNRDGWMDIYVTNVAEGNVFLENNGDGTFTDVASANGTLMNAVSWGAVFLDSENDTDLDLYVSGMGDDPDNGLTAAYYQSDGLGQYTIPTGTGLYEDHAISFGNAMGDIDNNGYPDIAVLNYAPSDMFLFKNTTNPINNWFKVKLQGVESNRQGIGSWVEISVNGQKQYNYTLCGEGFLSQNSAYEFFGIGDATEIEYVKVTWLSGIVDYIENPQINSAITIIEGSTLGTLDFLSDGSVTVYPNPTSGMATVKTTNNWIGSEIRVTDILGRTVFTQQMSSEETLLDVSQYQEGVYFILGINDHASFSKKLVIK